LAARQPSEIREPYRASSRTNLPQQFDEYVRFNETGAATPPDTAEIKGLPDTYPFGV
jgi:hypothetical protein